MVRDDDSWGRERGRSASDGVDPYGDYGDYGSAGWSPGIGDHHDPPDAREEPDAGDIDRSRSPPVFRSARHSVSARGVPMAGSRFIEGTLSEHGEPGAVDDGGALASEGTNCRAPGGPAVASRLKSSSSYAFLAVAESTDRLAQLERGPRVNRQETSLQRFRDRFNPQEWLTYIHSMEGSVFSTIWVRVVLIAVWTLLVSAYSELVHEIPAMSTMAHQVGGAVLALFITFRTNSSYQRFYAGVHSFAQMLSTLQGIARVLLSHGVTGSGNAHQVIFVCLALVNVFPIAAKQELRDEASPEELERFIGDEPIYKGMIRDAPDKCTALFQAIGLEIVTMRREGVIDSHSLMYLEEKINVANGLWHECLKIARVPVPYVFAIEGTRIAVFFLVTFPIVLVPYFGWYTVIAMTLLSYEILAIEALGSEIEDPFGRDANDIQLDEFSSEHIEIIAQMAKGAHWHHN